MDEDLFTPEMRQQLKLEIEQLAGEGYGRDDLVQYAKGFKDGFGTSTPAGLAGKVVQGVTLGYGDEIKGAVRAPFTGNGRLYETARARGQLARAQRDAPITSTGLEVAGSLAPAIAGGAGLAGVLGRAGSLGGNIARGAAAGAVAGGVYGSGNAVGGPEARAAGAIPGALVGGAVGGAMVPATELGLAAARRVVAALTQRGGDAQAGRALRTAIEETVAPGTPGAAMQPADYARTIAERARQAQAGGTPLTMAEAVGQQGVDLLESAAQAPGPGREAILQQLGERQMAQPGRLVDALRTSSGVTEGSLDQKLATAAERGATARPLYESLGGIDVPDDVMRPFWSFLQTRAGKSAYRRAAEFAEQAKLRGEPFGELPTFEQVTKGARLTVGEADVILQGLEATAERKMTAGMAPGTKAATKDSINYNKTADYLRGLLKKRVPEFEQARAAWAGPTQFIQAIDKGAKALGMDLDTFKTVFGKASAAEQEGMKIGLVNALKSDLEQFAAGPTADASRNLARRYAVREKLRMALGPQADDLLRTIDTEATTSATAAQTMGNSATARRLAAAEALGDEQMTGLPTSPQGILSRIVGKLDEVAMRNTRNAIARLGLTTDPDEIEQLVQAIMSAPPGRPRGTISGAVVGGSAGAGAAALADR